MANDRWRLARAFGIDPMPEAWSAAAGAGMAAFAVWVGPFGLAPSAALLGMYVAQVRKVRAGLREVEAWGFPVEGYRAWILAREPTFELELRAEVGSELVEQALAALDPAIAIERRGPGLVR